jgi:hypothetical protein
MSKQDLVSLYNQIEEDELCLLNLKTLIRMHIAGDSQVWEHGSKPSKEMKKVCAWYKSEIKKCLEI